MEKLISFDLAVKAKEKGYDGDCDCMYHIGKKKAINLSGAINMWDCNKRSDYIDAPSIYEIERWLREKHKFFIEVSLYEYPEGDFDNFNVVIRNPYLVTGAETGFTIGGYDNAHESGIDLALDLIKV